MQFLAIFPIDDTIFHYPLEAARGSFFFRYLHISNSRRRIESFWISQSAFGNKIPATAPPGMALKPYE